MAGGASAAADAAALSQGIEQRRETGQPQLVLAGVATAEVRGCLAAAMLLSQGSTSLDPRYVCVLHYFRHSKGTCNTATQQAR